MHDPMKWALTGLILLLFAAACWATDKWADRRNRR